MMKLITLSIFFNLIKSSNNSDESIDDHNVDPMPSVFKLDLPSKIALSGSAILCQVDPSLNLFYRSLEDNNIVDRLTEMYYCFSLNKDLIDQELENNLLKILLFKTINDNEFYSMLSVIFKDKLQNNPSLSLVIDSVRKYYYAIQMFLISYKYEFSFKGEQYPIIFDQFDFFESTRHHILLELIAVKNISVLGFENKADDSVRIVLNYMEKLAGFSEDEYLPIRSLIAKLIDEHLIVTLIYQYLNDVYLKSELYQIKNNLNEVINVSLSQRHQYNN